jgi:hypothetical protein
MAWSEKAFEESMTPHIDTIYKKTFRNLESIYRSNRDTEKESKILFMDKELAIDTFLHFKDGSILTFQEKTRRKYYLDKFGADFTFEYYNNPATYEQGEWFKLAAQIYFYGYADESMGGYCKYWVIDIAKLRIHLKNNIGIETLEKKYLKRNPPPAKANFFAVPFDLISDECILCRYDEKDGITNYRSQYKTSMNYQGGENNEKQAVNW